MARFILSIKLYTYNTTGEKLRVEYYINQMTPTVPQVGGGTSGGYPQMTYTKVDYCNGLIFERYTLKQIPIEGGYVTFNGTTPQYHFYIQDHQGNNRLVCDESGTIEQVNHYYPYGGLMGESEDITSTQRYKYNGKELDRMHGLNLYDYGARQYDAALGLFTTMDPLAEKYYNVSPYAYCVGNPVMYVDPDGCDSIHVNCIDNMWQTEEPVLSKGDDVFIINDGNKTSAITYNEGEYGKRVCALNLDVNDNYTLGVYYVSGAGKKGCGFYVTPGGEASSQVGSGARIPEGNYPILAPNGGKWQQPQVGGIVAPRGIRFHYGYPSPRNWTEGCFVLSHNYYIDNGNIQFNKQNSMDAVQDFDYALGGGDFYKYSFVNSRGKVQTRFGSKFENSILHKLYLRSR